MFPKSMKESTNQIQRDPQIAQFVSSLEPEVPEVESDPGEGLVDRCGNHISFDRKPTICVPNRYMHTYIVIYVIYWYIYILLYYTVYISTFRILYIPVGGFLLMEEKTYVFVINKRAWLNNNTIKLSFGTCLVLHVLQGSSPSTTSWFSVVWSTCAPNQTGTEEALVISCLFLQ